MPIVLVKREDGRAFISETEQLSRFDYSEGGSVLSPDDIVDGKKVNDWPAGVFTVKRVTFVEDGLEARRLTLEEMTKILSEVANGIEAPATEGEAATNFRAKMKSQVKAIRAAGGGIEFSFEWPAILEPADVNEERKSALEIDRG